MDLHQFETRKKDHITHALDPAHQASEQNALSSISLIHEALPELDFNQVQLSAPFLDRELSTPFFVPGMTAGHPDAVSINLKIAAACERRGWIMGVGSQRRELDADSNSSGVDRWRDLRKQHPKLTLVANLGLSQVIHAPLDSVRRVMDAIDADFLMVHLNALQEVLQLEGTPQFSGGLAALDRLVRQLGRPVGIKETGCGISPGTLLRVRNLGLVAVDCSGLGGTHWGRIEGARAPKGSTQAQAAEVFKNWGLTTVESVRSAAEILGSTETEVWASGGVQSGLDGAKLIGLGAHRVGLARQILVAALESEMALDQRMSQIEFELKTALFCTGCANPHELRRKQGVWSWTSLSAHRERT